MQLFFRSIVSSPKRTFYDPQYNFEHDLAFITSQLIVCSAPSDTYPLALYRYLLKSLVFWLKQQQIAGKVSQWHMFNLRSEHQGYADSEVQFRVSHYPFPDHHPPTLAILENCVLKLYSFLSQNPKNTAIVHCQEGMGRLGTICCAYLMYARKIAGLLPLQVSEAIQIFSAKRMRSFAGDAVSVPSQKRYLEYWYVYLNASKPLTTFTLEPRIRAVSLKNYSFSATVVDQQVKEKVMALNIKIGGYKISSDLRRAHNLKVVCSVTADNCEITIDRKSKAVDIAFKPETCLIAQGAMTDRAMDVFINFNGWCYTWFNMEYEATIHSQRAFTVDWDNIDGFIGRGYKGRKLFDSLHVVYG